VENVTLAPGDSQRVFVVVGDAVVQQVELTGRRPAAQVVLNVASRTLVELQSDRVFSPAWTGGNDPRVLSFTIDEPGG
jgi:hypothetical protein